jgi:hypothetical protein
MCAKHRCDIEPLTWRQIMEMAKESPGLMEESKNVPQPLSNVYINSQTYKDLIRWAYSDNNEQSSS